MFNARFVPCRVHYGDFFKSKAFFSCYPQISEQSVPLPECLGKADTRVFEASQSPASHGWNDTEPIIISSDSEVEPRIVTKSSKQRQPHHEVGGGQILTGTVKVQDRRTEAFLSDSDGAIDRTSGVDRPGISNSHPGQVPGAKKLEGGRKQFVKHKHKRSEAAPHPSLDTIRCSGGSPVQTSAPGLSEKMEAPRSSLGGKCSTVPHPGSALWRPADDIEQDVAWPGMARNKPSSSTLISTHPSRSVGERRARRSPTLADVISTSLGGTPSPYKSAKRLLRNSFTRPTQEPTRRKSLRVLAQTGKKPTSPSFDAEVIDLCSDSEDAMSVDHLLTTVPSQPHPSEALLPGVPRTVAADTASSASIQREPVVPVPPISHMLTPPGSFPYASTSTSAASHPTELAPLNSSSTPSNQASDECHAYHPANTVTEAEAPMAFNKPVGDQGTGIAHMLRRSDTLPEEPANSATHTSDTPLVPPEPTFAGVSPVVGTVFSYRPAAPAAQRSMTTIAPRSGSALSTSTVADLPTIRSSLNEKQDLSSRVETFTHEEIGISAPVHHQVGPSIAMSSAHPGVSGPADGQTYRKSTPIASGHKVQLSERRESIREGSVEQLVAPVSDMHLQTTVETMHQAIPVRI